ncbi:MAG: alanine--tRNA ligase, partial [Burkholderiaceae bacterium]|nr:alanine--tRNA ligase [Burkholderiaceae bacterium]
AAAARATGCADLDNPSLKVIADHIRATAFLVSDGVIPDNEGRGFVQRRIIRRAIRHGYKLGQKTPFFYKLVPTLVEQMGAAYRRLQEQAARVQEVLKAEEERFFETLENGMQILDGALAGDKKTLPGEVAFRLHDTYGFPLDLTQDVCRERGVAVDEAGFTAAMDKQKNQARAAGKFKMERAVEYTGAGNIFTGYERLQQQARVLALYREGAAVQELRAGQAGIVVLDATPFYAESGGQVGDAGTIAAEGVAFGVQDTQKIKADVFGHHGMMQQGALRVGDAVRAQVDAARRAATMRNHSATHLMHKALRDVLGAHVQQKGSLVDAEKTRFDFAHNAPVTPVQILEIERRVNAEILANAATQARVMDIDSAQKTGAMMLFGEKYDATVRVLDIGASRELCGGTHVARTGDIGLFKIVGESGVAAGVRRVEAVTGANALAWLQELEAALHGVAATLKVPVPQAQARLAQTLEQMRALEKEIAQLKGKLASSQGDELAVQAVAVGNIKVLAARFEGADAKTLRETLDKLKDKLKTAAIVLAAVEGGKVQLAAGVTADVMNKIKAGELVNFVASQVGGKGGGKPDMAMAGGTNAAALPKALESVRAWVEQRV